MPVSALRFLTATYFLLVGIVAAQVPENNFNDIQPSLLEYEDIHIDWTMTGTAQAYLNNGLNLIKEEKFSAAAGNLTQALNLDKSLWAAYYYRGIAFKLRALFDNARRDFETVLSIIKDQPEATLELGKLAQLTSRYDEAEKYYNQARKSTPEKAGKALVLLGNLELNQGNLQGARKKFTDCPEGDPAFPDAQVKLGLVEIFLAGKPEAGLPYFNKVLSKDSLHRDARYFRAIACFKNNARQSISDLSVLINYYPFRVDYRLLRGVILTETNDFEKAFVDFQKVLDATPVDERNFIGQQTAVDKRIDIQYSGYYLLSTIYGLPENDIARVKRAYCQYLVGKFEDGIRTLKEVKHYKNSALCLFLLGLGHEHSGQHEVAMSYYDAALAIDNDIQDAHTKRGIYYTNLSRWEKAEADFNETIRINSKAMYVYKFRGVARFFLRKYDLAINDFTIYLQEDSLDSDALESRAHSYLRTGQYSEGANDFLKCTRCSEKFSTFLEFLKPLLQQGDTTKVLSLLNRFSLRNSSISILLYKVNLLIELNRINEARALLESNLSFASTQQADLYSGALTALGVTCLKQNELDKAEMYFTKAIEQFSNARAYRERGQLYLTQQKLWKAKSDLKKAANMGDQEAMKLLKKL